MSDEWVDASVEPVKVGLYKIEYRNELLGHDIVALCAWDKHWNKNLVNIWGSNYRDSKFAIENMIRYQHIELSGGELIKPQEIRYA